MREYQKTGYGKTLGNYVLGTLFNTVNKGVIKT